MTVAADLVSLRAGGVSFYGWTAINISAGLESGARSFSLSMTLRYPGQANPIGIRPYTKCEIRLDSDKVLTGYVDSVTQSYSLDSNEVTVSGRSATGQLVDCSAITAPNHWRKKKPEAVAKLLADPYGITVKVAPGTDTGEPISRFSVESGETVFSAIERAAQQNALLVTDDADGALVLTTADTTPRTKVSLISGENILTGSGTFSGAERFSEIRCKGQTAGSDEASGETVAGIAQAVTDPDVDLTRVLIVTAEGRTNKARAKQRAIWETVNRAGKSVDVTYEVRGWRQGINESDPLWLPGTLARVDDRVMGIDADLLIVSVDYSIDDGGTLTTIKLAPPGAYIPLAPAKRLKGKGKRKGKITQGVGAWEVATPTTLPKASK